MHKRHALWLRRLKRNLANPLDPIQIEANTLSHRVLPTRALLSVLAALNEGKFSKAVDQFEDHFKFTDHALGLEFLDKRRLVEFIHKSPELFPDTHG